MFGNKYKLLYQQSQLALAGLLARIESGDLLNPITTQGTTTRDYELLLSARDHAMCAVRYEWSLPINLQSTELEGFIYHKGSLAAFLNPHGTFQIADYAVVGKLTTYGKLEFIKPIDFAGKSYDNVYRVMTADGEDTPTDYPVAIIIKDYSGGWQEDGHIIPRAILNQKTTIADQCDVFAQLKNNIALSIKRALALCDNEDQKSAVLEEARRLLYGQEPIIPIVAKHKKNGDIEQPISLFNFDNSFNTQNYCQTIDFYDKFRRKCNGIPSPDIFEKKERMISNETENSEADSQFVLYNGMKCRQEAVQLIKKYLKVDISVDYSDIIKQRMKSAENIAVNTPRTDETNKGE